MVSVEDWAVQKDDIANVDYVGTIDGVEFAGGKAWLNNRKQYIYSRLKTK